MAEIMYLARTRIFSFVTEGRSDIYHGNF